MSNADEIKGRAKEAAGDLTDDDELQREGKTDRLAGKAKEAMDAAHEKADQAIDSLTERLKKE